MWLYFLATVYRLASLLLRVYVSDCDHYGEYVIVSIIIIYCK